MRPKFHQRLVIFFCGIGLLIFSYDMTSQLKLIYQLRQNEKNLQKEYDRLTNLQENGKQKVSQILPIKNPLIQIESLKRLTILIQHHGLLIQTIEFNTEENNKFPLGVIIHLLAQGHANQIQNFLLELLQQTDFLDIKLKASRPLMTLDMNVLFYSEPFPGLSGIKAAAHLDKTFNPFCDPHRIRSLDDMHVHDLRNFSLETFKLVGSFHQGKKSIALIRLPNNFIYPVQVNEVIGEERARVITIQPQQIVLRLPDQTKKFLTL